MNSAGKVCRQAAAYRDHLVLPRGSATEVTHAVASLRENRAFNRVSCWGLIDRDDRSPEEIDLLRARNVFVLPVAEIENLFLLPDIARAIASSGGYEADPRDSLFRQLHEDTLEYCASPTNLERAVVRAARRHIDRNLKHLDLKDATTTQDLDALYRAKTGNLNVSTVARRIRDGIQSAIDAGDLRTVLKHYDDKALFARRQITARQDEALPGMAGTRPHERYSTGAGGRNSGGTPGHPSLVGRRSVGLNPGRLAHKRHEASTSPPRRPILVHGHVRQLR